MLKLARLAGLLVAQALARGTISPASAPHYSKQSFVVVVPNISANVPLTGFRLTPPAGGDVEAEADPDWTTTTEGRTLVWTSEGIPGGEEGRLRFRALLPDSGEEVTFQVEESYPSVPAANSFPWRSR